ncbi:MAG: hypothetical protein KF736_03685 [Acidobacteria bacterium]|nr:hypothetical protein [Acidobacteriota bacterium]MCW5949514.1 hypothetical protein [Pyrinomonadaceae bacterium]
MYDPIELLTQPGPRGQTITQRYCDAFASFGVRFAIESNSAQMLAEIREFLPDLLAGRVEPAMLSEAEHFYTYLARSDLLDTLLKNGSLLSALRHRDELIQVLKTSIRLSVAENAPDHVFIHAGVVAIEGSAILLPGESFAGKSTLVKTLVSLGAEYYSDEFAVIDSDGMVHPFAKQLSIRSHGSPNQIDIPVEDLGGIAGNIPLEIGLVVFTEYSYGSRWEPRILTAAQGVHRLIASAVGVRRDPEKYVAVLSRAIRNSTIIETKRNEAAEAADRIAKLISVNR